MRGARLQAAVGPLTGQPPKRLRSASTLAT
jgi:hypothetical protein